MWTSFVTKWALLPCTISGTPAREAKYVMEIDQMEVFVLA